MGSTSFTNKVVGIFSDSSTVDSLLSELNSNGFDSGDISVLARDYNNDSDTINTHSAATAYPDTDIRDTSYIETSRDVYPSGVSGSDVYPRGTIDPTFRGEVAGTPIVETSNPNTVIDDYPAGAIGSNRFGTPDNSATTRLGSAMRTVDDKITGRDVLNNDRVSDLNRSDYTDTTLDESMRNTAHNVSSSVKNTVHNVGDTLRHADDAVTGRDSLNNNRDYDSTIVDRDVDLVEDRDFDHTHDVADKDPKAMVKGATAGGALGLIAGLGLLLIPGIGPVMAAGPLAAAVTAAAGGAAIGATAGTLIGILNDEGIPSDRADFYNRQFNKGSILVMIHTDESRATLARQILVKYNPETVDSF